MFFFIYKTFSCKLNNSDLHISWLTIHDMHHDYRLCKTNLKEFAQCNVVQAIRAVEDYTLLSYGFSQIFGGFGLAGSCRTLWGSAKI